VLLEVILLLRPQGILTGGSSAEERLK